MQDGTKDRQMQNKANNYLSIDNNLKGVNYKKLSILYSIKVING